MVAPVRETAAQALGAAVQPLPLPALLALLAMLRQLAASDLWEVCPSVVFMTRNMR